MNGPSPTTRVLSEYPGDPPKLCRNCEHSRHDRCHNGISGKWGDGKKYIGDGRIKPDDGCELGFYPCTKRWPLAKRMHQEVV